MWWIKKAKTLDCSKFVVWLGFFLPKSYGFNTEASHPKEIIWLIFWVFHRGEKRLFPKGNTFGFEWLLYEIMRLLLCLLIIIYEKRRVFCVFFFITVISMYILPRKSTEKSVSYTVYTFCTGLRCSCYMLEIASYINQNFKCKNTHTTCAIFKLGISEAASLLEPYYLTITPHNSIEKDFVLFYPAQHNPSL